jgi:hypothetical protein
VFAFIGILNMIWAVTDIFYFFKGSPSGLPAWVPEPAQAVLVALYIAFRLQSGVYVFRIYRSLLGKDGVLHTASSEYTVIELDKDIRTIGIGALLGIGSGVGLILGILQASIPASVMVLCWEAVAIVCLLLVFGSLSPTKTEFMLELEITIIYLVFTLGTSTPHNLSV